MTKKRKQSLFIVAYSGRDTADKVYEIIRDLQKAKKVDIKTAAVINRKDNGKLKLKHKRRLTVWKGSFAGGLIGLLLAGAGGGAVLGGAILGAIVGATRSRQRRQVKQFLDDELGPNESALAILISKADWEAVQDATAHYAGEILEMELTPEAEKQLHALSSHEAVAEAVYAEVEVEDDIEVEEVDEPLSA